MDDAALRHARFEAPHRLRMGLVRIDPREWIEVGADWAADLREKRRLLAEERARVLAVLPGSAPAQVELRDTLVRHLADRHPGLVRARGARVELPALGEDVDLEASAAPAIETAARLVQEDLCLLERSDAGWCLTAAAVCFPTRWDLPSKLGLPLAAIHEPVPGYAGALAASADRFFDALAPGPVFARTNWSLLDDAALFQPVALRGGATNAAIDAANAGDAVFVRVERQTLRRLPATGAIVFTIRIHRSPLCALARDPVAAAALAASVRSMDPALARYKAMARVREAALAYLDGVSER